MTEAAPPCLTFGGEVPLPEGPLAAFDEVLEASWDAAAGTGRLKLLRRNRPDDWFYGCHFQGDPVMPGCWGVDAVWEGLKYFAARLGIARCDLAVGMEDVRFFGQIRPYDQEVVYDLTILSVESSGEDLLLTAKAEVTVDGVAVYAIGGAQLGTSFWEPLDLPAPVPVTAAPAAPLLGPLSHEDFRRRDRFSALEVVALSLGRLVDQPPVEMGLLPAAPMLQVGSVERLWAEPQTGEGGVHASLENGPRELFYAMRPQGKPAALSIDGVWQLLGLFLCWQGHPGTGRALGFERVDVFSAVTPKDRQIVYELNVLKSAASPNGDGIARADASVHADGRLILRMTGASVGCHQGIRYSDYPFASEFAFGGKVRARKRRSEP